MRCMLLAGHAGDHAARLGSTLISTAQQQPPGSGAFIVEVPSLPQQFYGSGNPISDIFKIIGGLAANASKGGQSGGGQKKTRQKRTRRPGLAAPHAPQTYAAPQQLPPNLEAADGLLAKILKQPGEPEAGSSNTGVRKKRRGTQLLSGELKALTAQRQRLVKSMDAWTKNCVMPEARHIVTTHGPDAALHIARALLFEVGKPFSKTQCQAVGEFLQKLASAITLVGELDQERTGLIEHLRKDHR